MRSSSRRWNAFVTHSHALNSRRTSYSASRQQPSLSSPDAMQLSLRVQPTKWTQRLLSWSTQSTPEVVGRVMSDKSNELVSTTQHGSSSSTCHLSVGGAAQVLGHHPIARAAELTR